MLTLQYFAVQVLEFYIFTICIQLIVS